VAKPTPTPYYQLFNPKKQKIPGPKLVHFPEIPATGKHPERGSRACRGLKIDKSFHPQNHFFRRMGILV
jgi:hypothetical protein